MPAPSDRPSSESNLRDREDGLAILGYLCAVNTASLSFMIRVVPGVLINPAPETVISIIVLDAVMSWFFILLTAVLPATIAYRIARSCRIHNIIYYLSCGAVIGAML